MGESEQALWNAANQTVQTGMGIALQSRGIKQQIKGQKQIMDIQNKNAREMADFNQKKQIELWEATNYKAQIEQMKKAGLNPGLQYGMSGGGGATTNAAQAQTGTGGNINIASIQEGLGIAMMGSQKQLIDAQAKNLNAQTKKLEGVDTSKTIAETENITNLAKNEKEKFELIQLQKEFDRLRNKFQNNTLEEAIATTNYEFEKIFEEVRKLKQDNDFFAETYKTAVNIKQQELYNLIAEITLTKQKTKESKTTTSAISTEERMNIKRTIEGLEQKWQEILNQGSKNINKLKDTNEYNILEGIIGTTGTVAIMKLMEKSPQMIKGYMKLK